MTKFCFNRPTIWLRLRPQRYFIQIFIICSSFPMYVMDITHKFLAACWLILFGFVILYLLWLLLVFVRYFFYVHPPIVICTWISNPLTRKLGPLQRWITQSGFMIIHFGRSQTVCIPILLVNREKGRNELRSYSPMKRIKALLLIDDLYCDIATL